MSKILINSFFFFFLNEHQTSSVKTAPTLICTQKHGSCFAVNIMLLQDKNITFRFLMQKFCKILKKRPGRSKPVSFHLLLVSFKFLLPLSSHYCWCLFPAIPLPYLSWWWLLYSPMCHAALPFQSCTVQLQCIIHSLIQKVKKNHLKIIKSSS